MDLKEEALKLHKENKGKIEIRSKIKVETRKDLTLAYTPGVAEVSRAIFEDRNNVWNYTTKQNSVAIVTDGSAVLGLGNIGPEAALPVMEGKALLFKEFANIDAFPICLATQDESEIIGIVRSLSPGFGGINLEDIAAPKCFAIEERLQDTGIPVFHDDQHGTAIVVLAALINAAKVAGKRLEDLKIVISGAGAAGTAIAKILLCLGFDRKICTSVKEIILVDRKGIIYDGREDLDKNKKEIAKATNTKKRKGTLQDAIAGADAFIGVSSGGVLTKEMVGSMSDNAIVFAMANPVPEIMPHDALDAGAGIVATGRSDFPNQVNNSLAFPGVFRGALDSRAGRITNEMKLAAAYALAAYVDKPSKENIIPDALDRKVVSEIAEAVKKASLQKE